MAYRCSVPDIGNLRKWFNDNFEDICIEHDIAYEVKSETMIASDIKAMVGMVKRKWWLAPIFSLLYIPAFPYLRYRWHYWDRA